MTKKAIAPHLKKVLQDYLNSVKNAKKSDLEKPFIPEDNADFILAIERCFISSYLLGMIHAEEENPDRKINAGDGDIPPVPFSEAIDFLKARVPMTKKDWEKLEPKLRFRAFTVAKLGTAVEIETAKQILISALEKGESYSQTWEIMNDIFGKGQLGFKAGYWENVFRTNTQTAYMAGKLQQYEKTPGIVAYQLMIIEDVRTSKICRNLITKSGRGLVLSVDDDFWKTKGFPPYHFQCRSSVRAIYQHQLKAENIKIDHTKHLDRFKPGEGFGGNPINKESWWKLTAKMIENAEKYGIWPDILQQTKDFDMISYQKELLQGYELIYTGKNGGYIEKSSNWEFSQKEMDAAKKLADEGHQIYLLPRNRSYKVKSPDCLIDGEIAEFKQQEELTQRAIENEIRKAKKQRARIVYLKVLDDMEKEQLLNGLKSEVMRSPIKIVYLDWQGNILRLLRKEIREMSW